MNCASFVCHRSIHSTPPPIPPQKKEKKEEPILSMLYYHLAVKNNMNEVQCFYNSSSRTESITLRFNTSGQQLKYTDLRMDVKNFHPWICFPKCKKTTTTKQKTIMNCLICILLTYSQVNILDCKSQDHTMLSTAMHKASNMLYIHFWDAVSWYITAADLRVLMKAD